MNGFAVLLLLLTAAALLALPRRWAPLPLLMGACYMTNAQSIMLGPFHFTVLRVLMLLGFIRAAMRHERLPGGLNGLDWLLLFWGAWMLCSTIFHQPFTEALVTRLGIVYNCLGIYFLIRLFCQSEEDMIQLIIIIAFVLVPVALEMVNEKVTHRNLFGLFGGVPMESEVRDGKLRAQGPFGHSILAGTVGAVCVPFMIGIWRQNKRAATIGLTACLAMVVASKSSGPLMSLACGLFGLVLWRWRHLTPQMRIAAVVGYFLIDLVSTRPAYFALLNRIDLTGSSTGWHRAELIRSSFEHLNEWWFAGTDYTRHWMPYGVSSSPDHCDITNQYLAYGVSGGLLLMILFICALWVAFRYVGEALRQRVESPFATQFLIWSLGTGLFVHAATCISVSYFEQSVIFLYLNLALLSSLHATALVTARDEAFSASGVAARAGVSEPGPTADLPPAGDGLLARATGTGLPVEWRTTPLAEIRAN